MNKLPYVGITGVTEQYQSEEIIRMMRELGWPPERQVMIGVLASYRGLLTGVPANPNQYPPVRNLGRVLVPDNQALGLIHYNSRADGLARQLIDLYRVSDESPNICGVQLNVVWPDPRELRILRDRRYCRIVLQLGTESWRRVGCKIDRLLFHLERYRGLVDYVLVDPSAGTGLEFNDEFARMTISALVRSDLDMMYGIAGGLNADRIPRLAPLLDICPDLSWDAQSRLRTQDGYDQLDMRSCQAYLEASHKLLVG